jgi:hypothetical protein
MITYITPVTTVTGNATQTGTNVSTFETPWTLCIEVLSMSVGASAQRGRLRIRDDPRLVESARSAGFENWHQRLRTSDGRPAIHRKRVAPISLLDRVGKRRNNASSITRHHRHRLRRRAELRATARELAQNHHELDRPHELQRSSRWRRERFVDAGHGRRDQRREGPLSRERDELVRPLPDLHSRGVGRPNSARVQPDLAGGIR